MKWLLLTLLLFSLNIESREYNFVQVTRAQLESCGISIKRDINVFDDTTYLQLNGALLQYKTFVEASKSGNICTIASKMCDFNKNADELLIEINEIDKALDFLGKK